MLANSVGDLQKGERCVYAFDLIWRLHLTLQTRYINMDLVYLYALLHKLRTKKMTIYDIICQWVLWAQQQIEEYPKELQVVLADYKEELFYAIGKLHWHGHKEDGHSRFSLNYIPGSGRTDGEGIERRWWDIQPIATSTRMMGPGGRQGTLNDVWGFANWVKLIELGAYYMICSQRRYTNPS